MNGIEKIIARIGADSAAECEAIGAEAQKKCDEIRATYENTAKNEYWKIINKGAKEAEIRFDRLGDVAAVEAKKQILALKQEMISMAFGRAEEMIAALPDETYVPLLVRLAVSASRTGDEQIIMSASDRAHLGKTVCIKANESLASQGRPSSLTLSEQTRDIRGGLILSSGNIEVNCSVEALTAQYRDELAQEVAEALFE